jgi:hypothetical protein
VTVSPEHISPPVPRTLCIGVDVTWWGGSPRRRDSQRETVVSAVLDDSVSLRVETVNLHDAINPDRAAPTEANFDAGGAVICAAIAATIRGRAGTFDRLVIALDAPLEANVRPDQPPRHRAVAKGVKAGSKRRQSEDELQSFMRGLDPATRAAWAADLKIQSGSPIPPRIAAIVGALGAAGYPPFRPAAASDVVLEVFPSEAIFRLGVAGHYGALTSAQVRSYKAKKPARLAADAAHEAASRPLLGFVPVLECGGVPRAVVAQWVSTLSDYACTVAGRDDGSVRKSKGFDDPIDSGIAFLTAAAFALGQFHAWGDGSDGVIVGPGVLQGRG